MDLDLWENTAVVKGGNRGIGLATAKGLGIEGYDVVICALREEELSWVSEQIESLGVRVGANQAWRSRQ